MSKEEIERSFLSFGWDIDGSFTEYLLIGCNDDGLSILAYPEEWHSDDPVFEIIDHERNLTYGVGQIPTPRQARDLLKEHGQPPEELDQPSGGGFIGLRRRSSAWRLIGSMDLGR